MVPIPTRTVLAAMQRPDIQKLCKDNNIKANMRTEEMIDALCGLATGKDLPRTRRTSSMRTVSQHSRPSSRASVKLQDTLSTKKALQLSESNTDPESETPKPAAPTTRRKAKEIQTHLGKGRPAIAGGSGARAVTKRKARASAAVAPKHDPIPEEDEETATGTSTEAPEAPVKTHQPSPAQLPTPTPSHPSNPLPSAHHIAALEARLAHLESASLEPSTDPDVLLRLGELETSVIALQAIEARWEAATQRTVRLESELTQQTTRLDAELERVKTENGALRERVSKLEAALQARDVPQVEEAADDTELSRPVTPTPSRGKRIGSIIIHSPGREEEDRDANQALPGSPAAPSPANPILGKRIRSDGTPGATGEDSVEFERVVRPLRKRPRVDSGIKKGAAFGGPSSTSTPRGRRSDSPTGFFTVGRRAPTPLARRGEDVDVDIDAYINLDDKDDPEPEPESEPGPGEGEGEGPGPGYFGSPPPILFPPGSTLPFPLHAVPSTPPPGPTPEMYTTPTLGAPWQHTQTPPPPTPTHLPAPPRLSPQEHRDPGVGYTFRGGRRERNDRYNPYFTPGGGHHTGLTPPLPPPAALGSPAKVKEERAGDEEQKLRTLYGTELEGDMRFGDFGRGLERWTDWAGGGGGGGGMSGRGFGK